MAELIELLCTIPGVKLRTAQVLIAECGIDMSVFPTVGHFASWAGICPGTNSSAGKRHSGKTRSGSKWLRQALSESAQAAARSKPPAHQVWYPGGGRARGSPRRARRTVNAS